MVPRGVPYADLTISGADHCTPATFRFRGTSHRCVSKNACELCRPPAESSLSSKSSAAEQKLALVIIHSTSAKLRQLEYQQPLRSRGRAAASCRPLLRQA